MNAVLEAIRQLGGPSEAKGRLYMLGVLVSETTIYRWAKLGRIYDLEAALVMSELTGISPWLLGARAPFEPPVASSANT